MRLGGSFKAKPGGGTAGLGTSPWKLRRRCAHRDDGRLERVRITSSEQGQVVMLQPLVANWEARYLFHFQTNS